MTRLLWRRLGWLGVIILVVLCVIPMLPPKPGAWPFTDKIQHAGSYLVLMGWFAVIERPAERLATAAWLLLLGTGIELVQGLLPYRTASWGDLAADGLGIVLGAGLAALVPAGFPRLRPAE